MKSQKNTVLIVLMGIVIGLSVITIVWAEQDSKIIPLAVKEYRIERNVSEDANSCIQCHSAGTPGLVAD